jgi:hypothetical protein
LKTITVTTEIHADRELHISLPDDVPPGQVEIVVVISPVNPSPHRTLGDLLTSEFFGMWHDREDIPDSTTFAQQLRREAWRRSE